MIVNKFYDRLKDSGILSISTVISEKHSDSSCIHALYPWICLYPCVVSSIPTRTENLFWNASGRKKVVEASVVKMTPNPQQGILSQDFQISLSDRITYRI